MGAYCNYNNDTNLAKTYGRLYNFYTVADPRNLCPVNWHVPSDADWNILGKYLDKTLDTTLVMDYKNTIGGKLKETGAKHWLGPNKSATNSSGFNALPGGFRNCNEIADFRNIGYEGFWWTSSIDRVRIWIYNRELSWEDSNITRSSSNYNYGESVRCVKD